MTSGERSHLGLAKVDVQLYRAIRLGRPAFWIPATGFASVVLLGLFAVLGRRELSFDPAQWQEVEYLRPRMVRDLLERNELVGKSRKEVDRMLGRPEGRDSVQNGDYSYWVGKDGVIDDMWLEIDFDDDVVTATRYVPD